MKNWKAIMVVAALSGSAVAQNVIDSWDFNIADTNSIQAALSVSDLGDGGQTWPDKAVAAISNNTAVFFADGTNTTVNYFSDASGISANKGAVSGVYELSVDIVSADFTNTSAKDQKATWGIGFRGTTGQGSTDNGFRLTYDGGLDVTNSTSAGVTNIYANADHFFLGFDAKDVGFSSSANTNFPGHMLSNLNVRQVYNLSNGTYQAYFTMGADPEALIYSGDLTDGFVLNDLRIASQQNNGGSIWEAGDVLAVDNIVLREIVAPDPVEPPALSGVLEEWLFEDANGTLFEGLDNTAPEPYGLGSWSSDRSWAYTTNGVLRYESSGTEAAYRNSTLSAPGETNGIFELSWTFTDAELVAGGDNKGAVVGYGLRDQSAGTQACMVRLLAHDGELRLQYLLGSTQNTMVTFNTNVLVEPVAVRIVADYDTKTADVYYTIGDGAEVLGADGVSMPASIDSFDQIRMEALLKAVDIGAGSFIEVDELQLSVVEPTSITTFVDVWDMDTNTGSQLSNNGLALPGTSPETHQFAQTDDDGLFIYAPTNASVFTGKTALSQPVVLTNNSIARLTLKVSAADITAVSTELANLEFRLWESATSANFVGLKVTDQGGAGSDAIRIGVTDPDGSNPTYGRWSNTGSFTNDTYFATVELDYNNSEIRLGGVWQWSPDGTTGVQTNSFDFAAAGVTELTHIQTRSSKWSTGDFMTLDSLEIEYTTAIEPEEETPETRYADWLAEYAVGSQTNLTDDADGDLLDNLSEYAFGGAPDDVADRGNTPVIAQTMDGGSNYIQHVHYERDDKADRGLDYLLSVGTDLVFTNWSGAGIEFVGEGAGPEGFNAVTNRVSTENDDQRFIRVQIEFTP